MAVVVAAVQAVMNQILNSKRPTITDAVAPRCRAIIEACWAQEPARRRSAAQVACILSALAQPDALSEESEASNKRGTTVRKKNAAPIPLFDFM